MKTLYVAAFAACALLPAASLAQQVQSEPDYVVQAPTQLGTWSDRVAQDLASALRFPAARNGHEESGIVAVTFTAVGDGSTSTPTIAQSSGSAVLDRAALRAVSRMGEIDPLPKAMGPSVTVRANIIFAQDQDQLQRYSARLHRDELARQDQAGTTQPQIALTVGLRPIG